MIRREVRWRRLEHRSARSEFLAWIAPGDLYIRLFFFGGRVCLLLHCLQSWIFCCSLQAGNNFARGGIENGGFYRARDSLVGVMIRRRTEGKFRF